jgi:hypothetical protein
MILIPLLDKKKLLASEMAKQYSPANVEKSDVAC